MTDKYAKQLVEELHEMNRVLKRIAQAPIFSDDPLRIRNFESMDCASMEPIDPQEKHSI